MQSPSKESGVSDAALGSDLSSQEESVKAGEGSKAVSKKLPEYKAAVVGATAVGKSALTIQLNYQSFVEDYDPTIQDSYWKELSLSSGGCVLNVIDTAGQPLHRALRDQCVAVSDGVLGVFSLDDPDSLIEVQQMRTAWDPHYTRPFVLVGNKRDLVSNPREILVAAAALAETWRAPFVETSAKTGEGVEEAFTLLIKEIEKSKLSSSDDRPRDANPRCRRCIVS